MCHLTAEHLTYRYRHADADALHDCSFDIPRGSKVALLGANGSGKTTLMLHLNGSIRAQRGRVLLDHVGQSYTRKGLASWRRRVGLVVQDPDDMLLAGTARQDLSFGPLNLGRTDAEARDDVERIAAALSLTDVLDRPTHLLSGGQRHRVAIAAVAVMQPGLILLDEPTSGLDPAGRAEMLDLLSWLEAQGTSIVLSTHDIDLAHAWAEQVVVMDSGQIAATGDHTVLHDDALIASARLITPSVTTMWRALPTGIRPVGCPRSIADLAGGLR